jgi:hypothetical protein
MLWLHAIHLEIQSFDRKLDGPILEWRKSVLGDFDIHGELQKHLEWGLTRSCMVR